MLKKTLIYTDVLYENLYAELLGYEEEGVCIKIDGSRASPMQVVQAHMTKEAGSYMRDYEMNPEGYIKTLSFVNINEKGEYDQTQPPFMQTGKKGK